MAMIKIGFQWFQIANEKVLYEFVKVDLDGLGRLVDQELCFSYVDPYQTDEERQATLELLLVTKTLAAFVKHVLVDLASS